jgi:hypothetical protein
MIEHLIMGITGFRTTLGSEDTNILIASGNLTKVKGGKPFFEKLGWEIAPLDRADADILAEPMTAVFAAIREQIETAVAPFRTAGTVENEPVTVAFFKLCQIMLDASLRLHEANPFELSMKS